MRLLLLANPEASAYKRVKQDAVERQLADAHDVTIARTKERDHAATLAREATATGIEVVVVLGGGATITRCFVFQQFNLIPNLSALENVTLPMEFAHVELEFCDRQARELLDAVAIAPTGAGQGHHISAARSRCCGRARSHSDGAYGTGRGTTGRRRLRGAPVRMANERS